MKRCCLILFWHVLQVGALQAQPVVVGSGSVAGQSTVDLSRYDLVFSDDFNGVALDEAYWSPRHENEVRNGALTTSTNVSVAGGVLRLRDAREQNGTLSASEISTEQHPNLWIRYGYFELRAKLSAGVGTSCAFWLQSPKVNTVSVPFNAADNGAEIDMFENGIAGGINKLYYSLHWNGYDPKDARSVTLPDLIPGIYQGFHVFGFEWTPQAYRVIVDGILRATTDTMISRTAEFLVLGNGRGGYGGEAEPFPNPDFFEIDYIKVYRRIPEVIFFEKPSYYGRVSHGLLQGKYTHQELRQLSVETHRPRSVEIPAGWQVIVYDQDQFRGNHWVLKGDQKTLFLPISEMNSISISPQ